jgi:hypothetical protein
MWRPPPAEEDLSLRSYRRVERVLQALDDLGAEYATLEPGLDVPPLGVDWRHGAELLGFESKTRSALEDRYTDLSVGPESGPTVDRWLHGDLAPGNVRLARCGEIALLDWEMFDRGYEPWFDRLYPALLAISSLALNRGHLARRSWPVRRLASLATESSIPLQQRCLRVTAELASRSSRLQRGSLERWQALARLLQAPTGALERLR